MRAEYANGRDVRRLRWQVWGLGALVLWRRGVRRQAMLMLVLAFLCVAPILNVSVTGGFTYSDLPKCGLCITVTSDNDPAAAREVAPLVKPWDWPIARRARAACAQLS